MANDPVLIAYGASPNKPGKRRRWRRIGKAYPHDVGSGLTLVLDCVPLDGRVVLLELDAEDDARIMRELGRLRSPTQIER